MHPRFRDQAVRQRQQFAILIPGHVELRVGKQPDRPPLSIELGNDRVDDVRGVVDDHLHDG